jgi:Peptidase A4 family
MLPSLKSACLLAFGLVLGCSSAGPGAVGETVAYQVASGEMTWIHVHVEPSAACVAHQVGSAPEADAASYFADSRGWVRLGVVMPEAVPALDLGFACTGLSGSEVDRVLALHAIPASAVAAGNPSPPPPTGRTIPALDGDPMSFTQRDLVALGYPPRPDPVRGPGAFAAWQAVVSKPTLVPDEAPIARERTLDNGTQPFWAGAIASGSTWSECTATWTVPWVYQDPQNLFTSYKSSAWPGLSGTAGLVQAGTEHDLNMTTVEVNGFPTVVWIAKYSAWYESLSDTAHIASFALPSSTYPVYPYDPIYTTVYLCDANQEPDPDGVYGCMIVIDTGPNLSWNSGYKVLPTDLAPGVVGTKADWIVEKPSANGTFGLSNFDTVTFQNLYPSAGSVPTLKLVDMVKDDVVRATTVEQGNGDIEVTWQNSN